QKLPGWLEQSSEPVFLGRHDSAARHNSPVATESTLRSHCAAAPAPRRDWFVGRTPRRHSRGKEPPARVVFLRQVESPSTGHNAAPSAAAFHGIAAAISERSALNRSSERTNPARSIEEIGPARAPTASESHRE